MESTERKIGNARGIEMERESLDDRETNRQSWTEKHWISVSTSE